MARRFLADTGLAALLTQAESSSDVAPEVRVLLSKASEGDGLAREEAHLLMRAPVRALPAICRAAASLRDRGKGKRASFSPKVFIPLTRLCRDTCGYCTFRQEPSQLPKPYMTPEEVLGVARAGARLGCTEALFTLGERPEQRYPEAQQWLQHRGYRTTIEYLRDMGSLVLRETGLLPHVNPGTMSRHEMESLREVSVSMGLMLENLSPRLYAPGGPHEHAPSKRPTVRLKTLELAGQLRVPFTTGILIGIGETPEERVDSLFAIRDLHAEYGHVQEVIVQNFRAKPDTPMAGCSEPDGVDMMRTLAITRIVLGPAMNIQAPPNLTPSEFPLFLHAGLNDWGGVSPLTPDFVNPEAPWPHLADLERGTRGQGFELVPRLPIYPEYLEPGRGFVDPSVAERAAELAGVDGYVAGGIARYVTK
ncbi:MAG: 7,8-didemethyl-8-hydroxy-5-deazariboflavin synthase subunit CofG [Dehalococcoidia bacterium]|nr:7,8-didemethyl-8-hydroxy-5-deazariboflavin synthase subunit CofG [Dehalococcoidia bacterium]